MSDKIKAVIVSSPVVHDFFAKHYENWDVQIPVWDEKFESDPSKNLNLLWDFIEEGRLDAENTKIVILSDELYDYEEGGELLIDTIAEFAPEVFLGITVTPGNETAVGIFIEHARARIPAEKQDFAQIYTIPANDHPIRHLDEALEHYERLVSNNFEEHHENVASAEEGVPEGIVGRVGDVDVSRQGIILAATSSKGGSGKSTVGFLLGSQIAQSSQKAYEAGLVDRPLKVAIVDLDTRDAQLGFLIGQSSPTSLNLRMAPNWGPEAIWNNVIYDNNSGMHVLLAPKLARTSTDVDPNFYQVVFNNMRFMYDIIILDTSVNFMDSLLYDVALPSSDLVLFVTTLDQRSVFGMNRWFIETTTPDSNGIVPVNQRKVAIIVNESLPNVGVTQAQVQQAAMGAPIAAAIPSRPKQEFLSLVNKNRLAAALNIPEVGSVFEDLARKIVGNKQPLVSLLPQQGDGTAVDGNENNTQNNAQPAAPKRKTLFKRG